VLSNTSVFIVLLTVHRDISLQ